MDKIEKFILDAVHDIVKKHPGGEPFFDALDDFLANKMPMDAYDKIVRMAGTEATLVMSGGFGVKMMELIDSGQLSCDSYMLFKGGLRKSNNPEMLRQSSIISNNVVFLDDTIYGGATYYKIKEYLRSTGVNMMRCIVFYDGCPVKKEYVDSMFRYYNHFNANPNFKF